MAKYIFLDFEFNQTAEPELNLVACAVKVLEDNVEVLQDSFWLLDSGHRLALSHLLRSLLPEYTLVSFALQAEARCLFDLCPWLTPKDLKGIDLYLNYRMLLNHNDKLCYGKQLIKGQEKVTKKPKPKFQRSEEESKDDSHKPEFSLAAACYKLLKVKIDTEHKTLMRDLIIKGDAEEIQKNSDAIMAYALSDVAHLPRLMEAERKQTAALGIAPKAMRDAWSNMADYAIRSAWMERLGYPVHVKELRAFTSKIPEILNTAAKTVNDEHPEIAPFQWNKKSGLFIKKEAPLKDWIRATHDVQKWVKTDKGQPSLSLDAFRRYYEPISQNFGGAMVRYLSTKQSLNGFTPNKTKRGTFYDYLGSDERARPYFGIYGAQSSRSQPSATGYLPLKAHWMRYFIQPAPGQAIVGIDYASQEFLIAALLSEDEDMVAAYASGDVYLAFGKQAGFIPQEGTKQTHKRERDIFKQLVLGVSYDMTAVGLAARLTVITGRQWGEKEADNLISAFYNTYSNYAHWKREVIKDYEYSNKLILKDGWTMFGDNDNRRSVGNFPVQGAGGSIMRRAVTLAQDNGLDVIYTLHDAIYAEHDSYDSVSSTRLGLCMVDAFMWYFDNIPESRHIRLDGYEWSFDYAKKMPTEKAFFPLEYGQRYVDERGEKDLESFKRFFN